MSVAAPDASRRHWPGEANDARAIGKTPRIPTGRALNVGADSARQGTLRLLESAARGNHLDRTEPDRRSLLASREHPP